MFFRKRINYFLLMFTVFLILSQGFAYAGEIMGAVCACGYQKPDMFFGGGRASYSEDEIIASGPREIMLPALCTTCKDIVVIGLYDKKICPKCSSQVKLYTDKSLQGDKAQNVGGFKPSVFRWEDITLGDVYYTCPKCGLKQMIFYNIGFWD